MAKKKKIEVHFVWHGETQQEMEELYRLLEDMLNDPELDITREEFAAAFYEQMFSKS